MQGTSMRMGDGTREKVYVERTTRECADLLIERGFATNFSEAVRVALAWCSLAVDAYDGLTAQRAILVRRRRAAEAGAPPRT